MWKSLLVGEAVAVIGDRSGDRDHGGGRFRVMPYGRRFRSPRLWRSAPRLGPTDAVAVSSLGKEAALTQRQTSVLKGESLFNDASGIVGFQFAIAAASRCFVCPTWQRYTSQ